MKNFSSSSKPETTVVAESITAIHAEPKAEPEGEPHPEWITAKKVWGDAWPTHWIGFTCLFGILTLLTILVIARLIANQKRRKRIMSKFSLTVTGTLLVFSASRFLYMFINPYESDQCLFGKMKCPVFLTRLIFSLGLPSLTSAFMLLHMALLDVMKMQKLSRFSKLQKWNFLLSLIAFSYVFAVTVELVVIYYTGITILISICQAYFIIWSASLIVAYLYTGLSIAISNHKNFQEVSQMSMQPEMAKVRSTSLNKVMRLTLVTSALAAVYLACQLYSLVAVYTKNSSPVHNPEPWPWLGYEYFHRLVEWSMAVCLLYNVSYRPREGAEVNVPLKTLKSNLTQSCSALKVNEI